VDVTLACADGSTLEAHKVILSSVSTYFRDILKVKTSAVTYTLTPKIGNKQHTENCFSKDCLSSKPEQFIWFIRCG